MKTVLLTLLCIVTVIISGCGGKFAKEKESITKAETAAMSMQIPVLVVPDYWKEPRPTRQEIEKYANDFNKLIEVETKMLAEMQKSDAQIADLESKAANDAEKKDVQEFKEKIHKARVEFVKKISRGRLYADTVIVGVGSTWQEIEMVYGKPKLYKDRARVEYKYDGLVFKDWAGKGVPPEGYEINSSGPQFLGVTSDKYTTDAGVKVGMTYDELFKILKSKYVKKDSSQDDEPHTDRVWKKGGQVGDGVIISYSTKETLPYNLSYFFKDGKLVEYVISSN